MQKESKKSKLLRKATYHRWIKKNPPNEKGEWECYLQISIMCPKKLTKHTMTLEHVKSKKSRPDLKYDLDNILPACSWCNYMKGSKSLDQLARIWPKLIKYIDTKEKKTTTV